MIKEFTLYSNYTYNELDKWFSEIYDDDPNVNWKELGDFLIGECFVVISGNNLLLSFVLAGYNESVGGVYKLIYKE